jgi:uncharacterized repeat protein (TIGR03806 family)
MWLRMKVIIGFVGLAMVLFSGCNRDEREVEMIPIPNTITFEEKLSAYSIYDGSVESLIPSEGFHELEMSAALFSNYSKKQRLVKLPDGTQMEKTGNGVPVFPEGTMLVKTFYYYKDLRDKSLGKRVMETRLLILEAGEWNVASYVWNANQTDATLALDGYDSQVSWISESGQARTINYHYPDQTECVSCHQQSQKVEPIGPSLRNLNREVVRDSVALNQIHHIQQASLIHDFSVESISEIPDYNDQSLSLEKRARAYFDMNCAHCHNPDGWEEPARKGFDLRYETPLNMTGLLDRKDQFKEVIQSGEMPYLGNTVLDDEGVALLTAYIDSL